MDPTHPKKSGSSPAAGEEEEFASVDDAVIGRAFRWSAIIGLAILVASAAVFLWLKPKKKEAPVQITKITAPSRPAAPLGDIPEMKFQDITSEAGITFIHNNGAHGDKLLPETMGSGCAFFDYNGDGRQDLLFVNGTYWPGRIPAGKKPTTMALYKNLGGRFEDVTSGSGLDISFYGMGVAAGDYDNDGHVDLFFTAVGQNRLFRNRGDGRFDDVTAAARVGGVSNQWSTCAAWMDLDNDGDLDLFVGNYVRWSKETDFEVGYKLVGLGRAYGPPMNFEGTLPYLYRNDGHGTFADISAESGLQIRNPATRVPAGKSLGVAPVDLDGDGWIDLVVANDTVPNFLFHNQQNGTFKELGAIAGVAFDSYGVSRGAMGIDAARFRNDQRLGIAIGNFANEMTALYVSQSNPLFFVDEAISEGIGPASRLPLKFGVFFFDYDLDGRLDLLTANGHLEEEINKVQESQQYRQAAQLFWNCGPEKNVGFVAVPPDKAGPDLFQPIVGRGSAYADIDEDGDLDLALTQAGGRPLLLRNDQSLKSHWIRLKLKGRASNRDAIGAWVIVTSDKEKQARQIMPTRSYLSQSELPATIGLGTRSKLGKVEILWPRGYRQVIEDLPLDRETVIQENSPE